MTVFVIYRLWVEHITYSYGYFLYWSPMITYTLIALVIGTNVSMVS